MLKTREYVVVRLDIMYPDEMDRDQATQMAVSECDYNFDLKGGAIEIIDMEIVGQSSRLPEC